MSVKFPLNPVTVSEQKYCWLGETKHLGVLLMRTNQLSIEETAVPNESSVVHQALPVTYYRRA